MTKKQNNKFLVIIIHCILRMLRININWFSNQQTRWLSANLANNLSIYFNDLVLPTGDGWWYRYCQSIKSIYKRLFYCLESYLYHAYQYIVGNCMLKNLRYGSCKQLCVHTECFLKPIILNEGKTKLRRLLFVYFVSFLYILLFVKILYSCRSHS